MILMIQVSSFVWSLSRFADSFIGPVTVHSRILCPSFGPFRHTMCRYAETDCKPLEEGDKGSKKEEEKKKVVGEEMRRQWPEARGQQQLVSGEGCRAWT